MLIVNRVPELVAEKFGGKDKVVTQQVQREIGLTYATVHSWLHKDIQRYDAPALEAWCKYLGVGVGEILVFQPETS